MKKLVVVFALALAVMGTFTPTTRRVISDGGPIIICPPKDKECWIHNPLPPAVIADGGPILVCPPGKNHDACTKNNPLPTWPPS